jgi:pimeloyl-ACP methyl ester carboxylesterase
MALHAGFLLPGFGGSELWETNNPNDLVWVSYLQLAFQQFGKLALSPDGTTPLPPHGVALSPRSPLDDFYGDAFRMLASQTNYDGYLWDWHGFDWRKGFIGNGMLLANRIRAVNPEQLPATIVAHSFGGLVARAAWRHLRETDEQDKIRRIITLGTSHQGSYSAVLVASGDEETVGDLYGISNLFFSFVYVPKAGGSPKFPNVQHEYPKQEIADVILTFPGFYDLLPMLGGTDAEGDPHRELLYDKTKWPSKVGISQAWLDHERDVVDPWLNHPFAMPPYSVLTTVAGTGFPTPWGLLFPDKLGSKGAIGTVAQGDGKVTQTSALIPTARQYTFGALHMDLPKVVTASGELRRMVLEERSDVGPPLPLQGVAGVFPQRLHSPPFTAGWPLNQSRPPCLPGECAC